MIPIEFFLNFSVNSNPISRAMGQMDGLLKTGAESLNSLKGRLEETMSAAGVIGTEMSAVYARIQTTTENIYGSGEAFSNLMQKKILSEFEGGLKNIESVFNATLENFDMTKISSQLKDLKFQDGFGDTFDKFNENLSKYSNLSSKLKPSQMKPMVDLLETIEEAETAEDLAAMNKELTKMIAKAEGINKTQEAFARFGQGVNNFMSRYISRIAGAVGAYTILDDAATAHTTAARSIARFGINQFGQFGEAVTSQTDRVTDSLSAFNEAVLTVGRNTQTSLTAASQAMSELAELRITRSIDDLGAMAETTTLMSKAFGVSTGEAAQFARSIVQIGGLSADNLRTAADQLANVQDEMGLTSQAARSTMNQVGLMMRQMTMFGATGADVNKVTREVGRLASAFEVAGLAADEANAILNKMMDPSQIADNAMMWHGLGMSVADGMAMMTGDVSQLEGMSERMRDLAKGLVDQYGRTPVALQEMARAYGMSFEQVQALSKLTDEDLRKREEETNLQNAALAARQGMMDQLQRIWGSLNIILQQTVLPLITKISKWLEKVAMGMQKFSDIGEGMETKWLIPVVRAIKGIIVLIGVAMVGKLTKIGKLIGGIGKGFAGLVGNVRSMVTGIGSFFSKLKAGQGPLKQLGEKLSAMRSARGGGVNTPAGAPPTGGPNPINNTQPQQVSKLGQAFKSFPKASQLLALAVAIVAIGAAVSGIVLSISVLAKVMKEFDLGQMIVFFIGVAAILIITMWGMVAAIGALGAISAVAAGPLLAAAVAIFAIGAAVAVVILSFAVLANAVANIIDSVVGLVDAFSNFFNMLLNSGKSFGEIVGVFGAIAVGMLMLAGAAALSAGPLMLFAVAAGIAAIPLMLVAPALMTIAQAGQMMQGLAGVFVGMAAGLIAMAPAMWAVSAAAPAFMLAIGVMAAGVAVMFLLGRASTRLAENMTQLGTGLQLIAENAAVAMSGLANLMSFFQSDQIAAMEQFTEQFAQQMQKIAESIIAMQVSVMVAGVAGFIGGLLGKITGGATGAEPAAEDNQMGAVVEQLIESNEHLNEIKANTAENIVLMRRLIASNRRVEMGIDFAR